MPQIKGIRLSEETKRKIGAANKGNKPWLGKHHSEEAKWKISESNKGRKISRESKKKISEHHADFNGERNPFYGKHHKEGFGEGEKNAMCGIHPSEETRKKMSSALIGNKRRVGKPSWCKGKKLCKETCKKISDARKGKSSWCKGLTKETDPRIARIAKIQSERKRSPEEIERATMELKKVRIKRPTKPQLKLLEIIKKQYPEYYVEPEWKVDTKEGRRFIDVAVPELMLGFEFDSPWWHKDKEKDRHRHELIESLGWKLTHYSDESGFPILIEYDKCPAHQILYPQ